MPKTEPFDNYSDKDDNRFIINKYAFLSELNPIKKFYRIIEILLKLALEVGLYPS